jgi:hypothetical protein
VSALGDSELKVANFKRNTNVPSSRKVGNIVLPNNYLPKPALAAELTDFSWHNIPKHTKNIPKRTKNKPKTYQKHTINKPKTYQKQTKNIPKTYQKHTKNIPKREKYTK